MAKAAFVVSLSQASGYAICNLKKLLFYRHINVGTVGRCAKNKAFLPITYFLYHSVSRNGAIMLEMSVHSGNAHTE